MRRSFSCLVSAFLGAVVAVWLVDRPLPTPAYAQPPDNSRVPATGRQKKQGGIPGRRRHPPAVFNQDGLTPDEAAGVYVYEQNNRSVANITTRMVRSEGFFSFDVPDEGAGSGCVIDSSGHILTNYHVIEDARAVTVTLFDGVAYKAEFVGADPINDTAVIRVDAPRDVLFPVRFGDSASLRVGMQIFAIGNPFGYERTMTTGIISSLNRTLQVTRERSIRSIIQVDAAINPGNSGGPLFDAHGRLIGMNTAIATRTGQSAGVGFAIPVNLIQRVVPHLIEHGRVIRPEIGIQAVYETEDGLLITRLTPEGPAELAGLRGPKITRHRRGPLSLIQIDKNAADLIVAVDGQPVSSVDDLLSYVESKQPGDTVRVTVIRDGRRTSVPVRLSRDPS